MKKVIYIIIMALITGQIKLHAQPDFVKKLLSDKTNNTEYSVGTLKGDLSVSPSGAAVYTLPIELPEGRAGMTPKLALVYNSQAGDGFMGKGWMLSGLEYVGRTIETPYYNGYNGAVDFYGDQYMLNGNKLIKVEKTCEDCFEEYRTEITSYERIMSFRYPPKGKNLSTSSVYFVVQNKNGIAKEYGKVADSRQNYDNDDGPTMRFYLSRIYDKSGNSIIYKYSNNYETGELYIEQIKYTLTNNNATDNKYVVLFEYKQRAGKMNRTSFFSSSSQEYQYNVTQLLKSITIKNENGKIIKKYDINYVKKGMLNKNYLQSIQLTAYDNDGIPKKLMPLDFTWTYNVGMENNVYTTYDNTYESMPDLFYTSGDFNGDGISDIAQSEHVMNGNQVERTTISFGPHFINSIVIEDVFGKLNAADFDADGKDELTIKNANNTDIYTYTESKSKLSSFNYLGSISGDVFEIGDYTGDGINDCIVKETVGLDNFKFYPGNTDIENFLSGGKSIEGIPTNNDLHISGDFTGNGVREIGFVSNNGTTIYSLILNEDKKKYILKQESFTGNIKLNDVYKIKTINSGDFNGDGKSDIIVTKIFLINGETETSIFYSIGKRFLDYGVVSSNASFYDDDEYFVNDLNNDGISDIYSVKLEELPLNGVEIHYKKYIKYPDYNYADNDFLVFEGVYTPNSKQDKQQEESHIFVYLKTLFGDFSGNGEPDINVSYLDITEDGNTINVEKIGFRVTDNRLGDDLITTITNGFGVKTHLSYQKYLCHYNTQYSYPVLTFKAPIYFNSQVMVENNKDGYFKPINYQFYDPVYHARGKGFLGFNKTVVTDYSTGIETVTKNDIFIKNIDGDDRFFFMYPHIIEKHPIIEGIVQQNLLSKTLNTINIKQTEPDNNLIFSPFIWVSFTKQWDLNNSFVKTTKSVTNEWDIDQYGNVKKTTYLSSIKNLDVYAGKENYEIQKVTEAEYNNIDETNWLVGRPTKTKVTKTNLADENGDDVKEITYEYYQETETGWPKVHFVTTLPNGDTRLSTKTIYKYDKYGNILTQTLEAPYADPPIESRQTVYEYSPDGYYLTKKIKTKDNIDYITKYDYYDYNGLLKTKIFNPVDDNHLKRKQQITVYEYDAFGKPKVITKPNGIKNYVTFNWISNPDLYPKGSLFYKLSYTGNSLNLTYTVYDRYERVLEKKVYDINNNPIVVINTYDDEYNRLVTRSEPHRPGSSGYKVTSYEYDALGRVRKVTEPAGNEIITEYNGRSKTVTNSGTATWKTITVNAEGQTEQIQEPTGTINYTYYSSGNVKVIDANGSKISMTYDAAGNRHTLKDPDAGKITYVYNAYGELIQQTDANNNTIYYAYDILGRPVSKWYLNNNTPQAVTPDVSYIYQENPDKEGFGNIEMLRGVKGTKYSYVYDEFGRIVSETETIDDKDYQHLFTYNTDNGKIETVIYPSGFGIKYTYANNGEIFQVSDLDNKMLWKALEENDRGQLTDFLLGNGLSTHQGFDDYGFPTEIITGNIQDLQYTFDPLTGNLMQRKMTDADNNVVQEDFSYDYPNNAGRLTNWYVSGYYNFGISYENNGNIHSKSDITNFEPPGQYKYGTSKPHAVTGIEYPTNYYKNKADAPQNIEYTKFNKAERIDQYGVQKSTNENQDYTYGVEYGPDETRTISVLYKDSKIIKTKYYIGGDYEIEKDAAGNTRKLHYLSGGNGLFAIFVQNGESDTMYYVHKDYQGSYFCITDESGNIAKNKRGEEQIYSFDPWGQLRNPYDWTLNNVPDGNSYIFDRGYTGQEHLWHFDLINLNGRLYDPLLGRMLQPDNYVSSVSSLQNFNRYSYVNNNPLKFVDPDGNNPLLLTAAIGAVIGGFSNWIMHGAEFNTRGLEYFGVGAFAGALAGLTGGLAAGFIGTTAGFEAGFLIGGVSGYTNGFITGFGNTIIEGGNARLAFENGIISAVIQGISVAIIGGLTTGIAAAMDHRNFWTGEGNSEYKYAGTYNYKKAKEFALIYNGSDNQKSDTELLHVLTKDKYYISEGDMGISKLTTNSGNYGITHNGLFVNKNGEVVAGYVHYSKFSATSEVHISPWAINDPIQFDATVGHELIHVIHHNLFGLLFNRNYSESVAYRYSASVYFSNGLFRAGFKAYLKSENWATWQSVPAIYKYHVPLWWP